MRACSAQRLDCAFRGVAVQPLMGGPPAEASAPCGYAGVLLQPCGQQAPCPSPLRLLVPGRKKPVMGRPELVMGREAELVPCARAARVAERGCGWLLTACVRASSAPTNPPAPPCLAWPWRCRGAPPALSGAHPAARPPGPASSWTRDTCWSTAGCVRGEL